MNTNNFYTYSEEETHQRAKRFGSLLKPGMVVVLTGPLGAGKTHFVKGVAEGLSVKEVVTSPTFALVNEYSGKIPLYHIDLYRIENALEFETTGFEDYLESDGVTFIEWGEKIKESLPEKTIWIEFEIIDLDERKITIKGLEE